MKRNEPSAKWFIMLRGAMGDPLPVMTLEDELAIYDSEEEADKVARQNIIGEHYGYRIYEW
jgi:hypothetical protein